MEQGKSHKVFRAVEVDRTRTKHDLNSLEGREALFEELGAQGQWWKNGNPSAEERDAMKTAFCTLQPLVERSRGAKPLDELRNAMPEKSREEQDRALDALSELATARSKD